MSGSDQLPDQFERPQIVRDDVVRSLDGMTTMLASDGYNLDIGVQADRIALTVIPGPNACADCLVPKDLFLSIASDMLTESHIAIDSGQIEIIYPASQSGHS